jgi:hypothetical protein
VNISVGSGLYLQIPYFIDGGPCDSPRTFLVIGIDSATNVITALNVSSVEGKEEKLLYSTNHKIEKYNPPFKKSSFVKLDAVYEIEYFTEIEKAIFRSGVLCKEEMSIILSKMESISATSIHFTAVDIKDSNQKLA